MPTRGRNLLSPLVACGALCGLCAAVGINKEPAAAPNSSTRDAASLRIAVTIDDLPWVGRAPGGVEKATKKLLDVLAERGAPVTGFVPCRARTSSSPLLKEWIRRGAELGNHQAGHQSLNKTKLKKWFRGVKRCHEELTELKGSPPRFFRYPYLHTGDTRQTRDEAAGILRSKYGYRIARVTIDHHEWKLAAIYGAALKRGNEKRARAAADMYVGHLLDATRHFRRLAQKKVGRDVAHILLLHANALSAHHFGRVLDELRSQNARFITLDEALEDPVYAKPDGYVGDDGISWLYRIAPVSESRPWDDRAWKAINERFSRSPE